MAVQVTVLSIDDEQLSAPKKTLFAKSEISIGRSRLNDLVLEHPGVSNTHARVRIEGTNGSSKFYVSDLDSTNGTMVGNKRLDPRSETLLADRDRIMIAGYILKIDSIAPEAAIPTDAKSNTIPSAEPKLPEGKTTNAYVIVEEAKLVASPTYAEAVKEPRENSGTVWNSSLLGAFREESAISLVNEISSELVVAKQNPVANKVKPSKEIKEVSWSLSEEAEETPAAQTAVPNFAAETKLLVEDHLTIDFVATKLLSIVGKVIHKGQPLAGVKISDATLGAAWSDKSGEFGFDEILEGTAYNLTFEKEGFILSPSDASGTLYDTNLSLEISARKLYSITGSITHRGSGLEGVLVDGGKLGSTKTDSHGSYKFENVAEGEEYTLKATKDGFTFGTVRKSA